MILVTAFLGEEIHSGCGCGVFMKTFDSSLTQSGTALKLLKIADRC